MIRYEWIDPEQAQPGDLLLKKESDTEYLILEMCVDDYGSERAWYYVKRFYIPAYEANGGIVDGKPTPALIARFTSPNNDELSACIEERKLKRLEIGSDSLVKVPGGIIQISEVKEIRNDRYYFGTMNWCEGWNGEYLREYAYSTREQAERERERLITWLEEA